MKQHLLKCSMLLASCSEKKKEKKCSPRDHTWRTAEKAETSKEKTRAGHFEDRTIVPF